MDFVAVKVGGRMLSAGFNSVTGARHRPLVAVVGMEVIIYVAVEVGGSVKPWTRTDKSAAAKPLRTVVPVRSASVRSSFVITIGAIGSYSDIDANLGLCGFGRCCEERKTSNRS